MAVLLYQIGIFIAIQIAASYGRNSRNTALTLISIFTILQVFMSWLLLLQFITIYFSFAYSETILERKESKSKPKPNNTQNFGRQMGELPNTRVDTSQYGKSVNNPILMSSIPSANRFLNKIIEDNSLLTYERIGSTKSHLFNNPIDIYKFYKSENEILTLYVYPYYNTNIEIVPEILKMRKNSSSENLNREIDINSLFNDE